MTSQDPTKKEDFEKCANFHGHICPGLAMGYRASKAGLSCLEESRASDEEIVALVENDACGADAVQVLTGCTFGKGNFIHKDYGKNAFVFVSRKSGKGVRVSLKPDAFSPSERHLDLMAKIRSETATREELEEFRKIHLDKSREVLDKPLEALFSVQPVEIALPEKAVVLPSEPCSLCGEPTMPLRLKTVGKKKICRACLNDSKET
jgi:formylmethanofuran dehydrogenase subunit E